MHFKHARFNLLAFVDVIFYSHSCNIASEIFLAFHNISLTDEYFFSCKRKMRQISLEQLPISWQLWTANILQSLCKCINQIPSILIKRNMKCLIYGYQNLIRIQPRFILLIFAQFHRENVPRIESTSTNVYDYRLRKWFIRCGR